jgi:hypothetical protein
VCFSLGRIKWRMTTTSLEQYWSRRRRWHEQAIIFSKITLPKGKLWPKKNRVLNCRTRCSSPGVNSR